MYDVTFVERDQLPEGHDWFISKQGCDYVFAVDPDCLTEQVLREAWVAFTRLSARLPDSDPPRVEPSAGSGLVEVDGIPVQRNLDQSAPSLQVRGPSATS